MCVFIDELFDGNSHKEQLDSLPCHRRGGSAAECDGLEDLPCARTIGIASHLAPELHGRADDKSQGQAATVAAWLGSQS